VKLILCQMFLSRLPCAWRPTSNCKTHSLFFPGGTAPGDVNRQ
jgi:hypothetical protein